MRLSMSYISQNARFSLNNSLNSVKNANIPQSIPSETRRKIKKALEGGLYSQVVMIRHSTAKEKYNKHSVAEEKDKKRSSDTLTVEDKNKELLSVEYKDKEFSRDTKKAEDKYKKG